MPIATYDVPHYLAIKGIPHETIINSINNETVWEGHTLKERNIINITSSQCLVLDDDMIGFNVPHYRDEGFDILRIGKIWEHIINDYYAKTIDQGATPLKHALDPAYKEKQISISIRTGDYNRRYGLFGLINPLERKLIERYYKRLIKRYYRNESKPGYRTYGHVRLIKKLKKNHNHNENTASALAERVIREIGGQIRPLSIDSYLMEELLYTVFETNIWTRQLMLYGSKRDLNNIKTTYSLELNGKLTKITIYENEADIKQTFI